MTNTHTHTHTHTQDPDYSIELDEDNPEFKKLAFTAPGPKNSFAPIKQGTYFKKERKRKWSVCLPGEDDSFQSTTGEYGEQKKCTMHMIVLHGKNCPFMCTYM